MAGLIANLQAGTKALIAHTKNVEISGKNLANVSNPNYARQRVVLGDRTQLKTTTGTESSGIEALKVEQVRDRFLDRQVLRETGYTAGWDAQQQVLSRAQTSLNQSLNRADDASNIGNSPQSVGGGLNEALSDFFNGFESVSAKPTDIGERQLLVQKASILAEKINSADQRLADLQTDVNEQINDGVSTVNEVLGNIAKLNDQIGRAEIGSPYSAVDLRDQRQAQMELLAKYVDFDAAEVPGSSGQVQISVKDASLGSIVLVDKNSVVGGIAFDGNNFTGGASGATINVTSGSMLALRQVRDGAVQDLRDGLKDLANQLTTAVNAAYNPTGTTGDFFSTSPTGLISVDPSVTPATLKATGTGLAGANEVAVAVSQLANKRFSISAGDAIDGTPAEYLSKITGQLGQNLSAANDQLENQQILEKYVRDERDGVSGVSMDEELTELLKYQRAFQASSRYVNVVDELLELVVTRLGN